VTFWAEGRLGDAPLSLAVTVRAGAALAEPGDEWRPFVAVGTPGKTARRVIYGRPGAATQVINVPLQDFVAEDDRSATAHPEGLRLGLSPGAAVRRVKDERESVSDLSTTVTLRSLADLPSGPVRLLLVAGKPPPAPALGWLGSPLVSEAEGAVTVQLASGRDAVKLLPLMREAQAFALEAGGAGSSRDGGLYFVRNNRLVAGILGDGANATALVQRLAGLLGASLAFHGRAKAFLFQPNLADDLAESLARARHQGTLFIYNNRYGERFYAVAARFLGESVASLDYLHDSAAGLFAEPVDIVPLHGDLAH
jgi:hypothetical protein